ncbi:CpaF family protein (plasmid) [Robbsia andropogonis]|uniref:CpaF family protein n=1 Tax=Robbsia andropogonis TaxID=28092 RepID=UPI003D2009E4
MNKRDAEQALLILRTHLEPIVPFMDDPAVQEIMINRPDTIWVERSGEMVLQEGCKIAPERLETALNLIGNLNGKPHMAVMDARMPGLRIAAARAPTSIHGTSMSIRKHSVNRISLDSYLARGAFDVQAQDARQIQIDREIVSMLSAMREGGTAVRDFFQWVIESKTNIILSGATSSGKTTLLNALTEAIPAEDRVVTIEDTAELQLAVPNYVSFETNESEGITIRHLVRLALRYRPNRVIVGEVRGAEAFDLLDVLNTGHPGSAVSFHSDTSDLAPARLESMIRMAPETQNWPLADLRRQIAATFRFIVHAQRVGGSRGPKEIREILGVKDGVYLTRLLFSKVDTEVNQYA